MPKRKDFPVWVLGDIKNVSVWVKNLRIEILCAGLCHIVRVEIEDGRHGMQKMNQESNVLRRCEGTICIIVNRIHMPSLHNSGNSEQGFIRQVIVDESATILMKLVMNWKCYLATR